MYPLDEHRVDVEVYVVAPEWRYRDGVASIQVEDVPDDVYAVLCRRAASAGQSLQEYLVAVLTEQAGTPTLDGILDRTGGRAGGRAGFKSAVNAIRAERDSR